MIESEKCGPQRALPRFAMISFSPKKLRDLNRHLFAEATFDAFYVPEAHFLAAFRTDFDGRLPAAKAGASGEDGAAQAPVPSCIRWQELRPYALQLVRGTQAPKSYSVVLKLPEDKTAVLAAAAPGADPDDVSGLYLNIRYAKEEVSVTTGCTLKTFSLDKSWEKVWDSRVEEWFSRLGLI